jgi:hypothetical protein
MVKKMFLIFSANKYKNVHLILCLFFYINFCTKLWETIAQNYGHDAA